MIKIRNVELDFDFNDADDMEKLENAIEKTQKQLETISVDNKKTSEVIRETCKYIFDCFNDIFGDGTDKKVFGDKTNLNICKEAFEDLINARIEQEKEFSEEMSNIEKKYSPNRATRRAKK